MFLANPLIPSGSGTAYRDIHVQVCTSNKMWAEVSNEFGPSCLINFGPDLDRNYLTLWWYGNVRFTFICSLP